MLWCSKLGECADNIIIIVLLTPPPPTPLFFFVFDFSVIINKNCLKR